MRAIEVPYQGVALAMPKAAPEMLARRNGAMTLRLTPLDLQN
jgi:hypothetical protein